MKRFDIFPPKRFKIYLLNTSSAKIFYILDLAFRVESGQKKNIWKKCEWLFPEFTYCVKWSPSKELHADFCAIKFLLCFCGINLQVLKRCAKIKKNEHINVHFMCRVSQFNIILDRAQLFLFIIVRNLIDYFWKIMNFGVWQKAY